MFSLSEFVPATSRSLVVLILGSHCLALSAIFISALDPFVHFVLYVALGMSLVWHIYYYVSGRRGVRAIRWNTLRREIHLCIDKQWLKVDEVCHASVLPYAVVLRVKLRERMGTQSVVVFFDSLRPEQFRRLKVLAIHGAYVAPDGH